MPIPSVEECRGYGGTIDLPASECGKFHDYHTSKGWLVGKAPMKDWKAAMRTWKRNHDDGIFGRANVPSTEPTPEAKAASDAEVNRINREMAVAAGKPADYYER